MSDSAALWPPAGPRSVVLRISGGCGDGPRAAVCTELAELLRRSEVDVVSCDTSTAQPVDLGVVDLLARLALLAKRAGVPVRLRKPTPAVRELVHLAGLDEGLGS